MSKLIPLSNPDGSLRDDAYFRVMATSFFPKCPASVDQAVLLAKHEQQRFLDAGEGNHQPSRVSEILLTEVDGRASTLFLAGYMAIALWARKTTNQKTNQYSAVEIVQRLVPLLDHNATFQRFAGNRLETVEERLPKSKRYLNDVFKEYVSVAHICAARVAAADFLELGSIFDPSPEAEKCVIQTAAFFQEELADVYAAEGWEIWDLLETYPDELADYPALVSEQAILNTYHAYGEKYPTRPSR